MVYVVPYLQGRQSPRETYGWCLCSICCALKRKKTSVRLSALFFLTLECLKFHVNVRQDIIDYSDGLIAYVITLEESRASYSVSFHLHCFLEFSEPILLENLRKMVLEFANGAHFNLQACKSRKSCIKYITTQTPNFSYPHYCKATQRSTKKCFCILRYTVKCYKIYIHDFCGEINN